MVPAAGKICLPAAQRHRSRALEKLPPLISVPAMTKRSTTGVPNVMEVPLVPKSPSADASAFR